MSGWGAVGLLDTRTKNLDPRFSYKLNQSAYGLDVAFAEPDVNEREMSVTFPFADGSRRDGVGDLLEVEGIRTERHRLNPVVLFDHGKNVVLPVGLAEDPDTKKYTVTIDAAAKQAKVKAFYYQGNGLGAADRSGDHALFCEQLFSLVANRFIRAGSIGYQAVKAMRLPANPMTGVPEGLHLIVTNLLEVSQVVVPANQDTVLKALAMPKICGKSLSPLLVKSLQPYAGERKAQMAWDQKAYDKEKLDRLTHGDFSEYTDEDREDIAETARFVTGSYPDRDAARQHVIKREMREVPKTSEGTDKALSRKEKIENHNRGFWKDKLDQHNATGAPTGTEADDEPDVRAALEQRTAAPKPKADTKALRMKYRKALDRDGNTMRTPRPGDRPNRQPPTPERREAERRANEAVNAGQDWQVIEDHEDRVRAEGKSGDHLTNPSEDTYREQARAKYERYETDSLNDDDHRELSRLSQDTGHSYETVKERRRQYLHSVATGKALIRISNAVRPGGDKKDPEDQRYRVTSHDNPTNSDEPASSHTIQFRTQEAARIAAGVTNEAYRGQWREPETEVRDTTGKAVHIEREGSWGYRAVDRGKTGEPSPDRHSVFSHRYHADEAARRFSEQTGQRIYDETKPPEPEEPDDGSDEKRMQTYENPLSNNDVPPAKWKPGVGVVKSLRMKYRQKSNVQIRPRSPNHHGYTHLVHEYDEENGGFTRTRAARSETDANARAQEMLNTPGGRNEQYELTDDEKSLDVNQGRMKVRRRGTSPTPIQPSPSPLLAEPGGQQKNVRLKYRGQKSNVRFEQDRLHNRADKKDPDFAYYRVTDPQGSRAYHTDEASARADAQNLRAQEAEAQKGEKSGRRITGDYNPAKYGVYEETVRSEGHEGEHAGRNRSEDVSANRQGDGWSRRSEHDADRVAWRMRQEDGAAGSPTTNLSYEGPNRQPAAGPYDEDEPEEKSLEGDTKANSRVRFRLTGGNPASPYEGQREVYEVTSTGHRYPENNRAYETYSREGVRDTIQDMRSTNRIIDAGDDFDAEQEARNAGKSVHAKRLKYRQKAHLRAYAERNPAKHGAREVRLSSEGHTGQHAHLNRTQQVAHDYRGEDTADVTNTYANARLQAMEAQDTLRGDPPSELRGQETHPEIEDDPREDF